MDFENNRVTNFIDAAIMGFALLLGALVVLGLIWGLLGMVFTGSS